MKDSRDSKNIFIIVTNRCNLRCVYCYEQGKGSVTADVPMMKGILRDEFADSGFDSFDVIFHGGEPFAEFGIVKELSEWIWQNYSDCDIRLLTTTNGTLLDDNIKSWLSTNARRFIPILSLDGGRETHNHNRCNSFDRIDFNFFLQHWPRQRVKMTVNPDGLHRMFDDIMEIRNLGFRVNPSLAQEVTWNLAEASEVFSSELEKLVQYYLDNPQLDPCPMLDLSPALLAETGGMPRNKACGAGTNNVAYDMHGHRYPCHSFITDFKKPYNANEVGLLFADLNKKDGVELCPRCEGCWAFRYCEPCYGMNYSHRGDMGCFDPAVCTFTKLRVRAAASMYAHMILSSNDYWLLRDKTNQELNDIIAGINLIHNSK